MDRISKVQFSSLPTFSEQIGQKIQTENDHYQFTVEPSMLEKSGVLANGGHDRSADEGYSQMMHHSGRNLIVEQLIIHFYRLCRWTM